MSVDRGYCKIVCKQLCRADNVRKRSCGTCCVPFMNSTILFSETKSSSAFRNSGFKPGAADTPLPRSPAPMVTAFAAQHADYSTFTSQ